MKKGWIRIGKVERPQKALVIVDGKGNVLARKIRIKAKKVKR
jgi:hypothetical protein